MILERGRVGHQDDAPPATSVATPFTTPLPHHPATRLPAYPPTVPPVERHRPRLPAVARLTPELPDPTIGFGGPSELTAHRPLAVRSGDLRLEHHRWTLPSSDQMERRAGARDPHLLPLPGAPVVEVEALPPSSPLPRPLLVDHASLLFDHDPARAHRDPTGAVGHLPFADPEVELPALRGRTPLRGVLRLK